MDGVILGHAMPNFPADFVTQSLISLISLGAHPPASILQRAFKDVVIDGGHPTALPPKEE